MSTTNSGATKVKYLDPAIFAALPESLRTGYAPRPAKVSKPKIESARKHFVSGLADYSTSKERLADHAAAVATGSAILLSGLTKDEAGKIFDATKGAAIREDLENVEASAVAWTTKTGKVKHSTNSSVVNAVAAALARLQGAKDSGNATEERAARRDLALAKAA